MLEAALDILAEHGEDALRIDVLCKRLGVTKGSFYHHFSSREDLSRQLLEYWVEEYTNRYIELSSRAGSPMEQCRALDNLALDGDAGLGAAFRSWALRDPLAREYQERVDAVRLDHLKRLYAQMIGDEAEAERLAVMDYAMFIGSRQIMPRLTHEALRRLPGHWLTLLESHYGMSARPGTQTGATDPA